MDQNFFSLQKQTSNFDLIYSDNPYVGNNSPPGSVGIYFKPAG